MLDTSRDSCPVSQRIAPKGVGSGISVRNLPSPSLQHIQETCDFYLSKASGCAASSSKSSRLLLECCTDISKIVAECRLVQDYRVKRLERELEQKKAVWEQWEKVLGVSMNTAITLGPEQLTTELENHRKHNHYLQEELLRNEAELNKTKQHMQQQIDQQATATRKQLFQIRKKFTTELDQQTEELNYIFKEKSNLESELLSLKAELSRTQEHLEISQQRCECLTMQLNNLVKENTNLRKSQADKQTLSPRIESNKKSTVCCDEELDGPIVEKKVSSVISDNTHQENTNCPLSKAKVIQRYNYDPEIARALSSLNKRKFVPTHTDK